MSGRKLETYFLSKLVVRLLLTDQYELCMSFWAPAELITQKGEGAKDKSVVTKPRISSLKIVVMKFTESLTRTMQFPAERSKAMITFMYAAQISLLACWVSEKT